MSDMIDDEGVRASGPTDVPPPLDEVVGMALARQALRPLVPAAPPPPSAALAVVLAEGLPAAPTRRGRLLGRLAGAGLAGKLMLATGVALAGGTATAVAWTHESGPPPAHDPVPPAGSGSHGSPGPAAVVPSSTAAPGHGSVDDRRSGDSAEDSSASRHGSDSGRDGSKDGSNDGATETERHGGSGDGSRSGDGSGDGSRSGDGSGDSVNGGDGSGDSTSTDGQNRTDSQNRTGTSGTDGSGSDGSGRDGGSTPTPTATATAAGDSSGGSSGGDSTSGGDGTSSGSDSVGGSTSGGDSTSGGH